jgi:glycosyltransferase involved in cell wall biosynthesis
VPPWGWLSSAFLLNASNTNRHKNHETLLKGVALWGKRYPLVLAGEGSDLRFGRRALQLRQYARQLGFVAGNSLHPLGYVSEGLYRALLGRAWAVVVASRAEGGGSFPAWEAIECGVPVICAETPAVQEHLDWLGAKALWFDPDRPDVLADRLSELERDYDHFKAVALAQRASIRRRSWEEVAKDYWDLILNAE